MSEPVQFEVKKLFLDALNAKPYRVVLYGMYTGWRDETRTMIVDEAHGLCKIEYDKVSVLNSHGTDIDYELYCSEDYTLERMADILENEYSPAAISKANPGQREYYKPEAYAYAAKLRESGAKFSTVQTVGKAFLSEHLPECEITRLNYASCSTIVFEAVRQSGEKVVIKMSQIHKAHKAIVDADLDRLISLEGDNNLLPIYGKKWFSLEANYETLLIWHPLMETIRSDGKNFSMTQDKAKYTWTFDWRIRLAVALAKALKTLHENGLVHHDVKPENLFYVNNESEIDWYLGDFDSIKPVEQQYEGKTTGTLAYAAPEILERKPFSFSSDIYAWGRTMFFLLHGSVPNGNVKASVEIDGKKIHLHTKGSSKTQMVPLSILWHHLRHTLDGLDLLNTSNPDHLLTSLGPYARMPNLSFSHTKSSRRSGQTSALQNGYAETAANKAENMNDVILAAPSDTDEIDCAHSGGDQRQNGGADPLERDCQVEERPAPESGGEIDGRPAFKPLRNGDSVHIRGGDRLRERGRQVRHEI